MFQNIIKRLGWWGVFALGMVSFFICYVLGVTVPLWLFWLMVIAIVGWVGYLLVRDYIKYYKGKVKQGHKRQAIATGIVIIVLTLAAGFIVRYSGLSERLFPEYYQAQQEIIEPASIDEVIRD